MAPKRPFGVRKIVPLELRAPSDLRLELKLLTILTAHKDLRCPSHLLGFATPWQEGVPCARHQFSRPWSAWRDLCAASRSPADVPGIDGHALESANRVPEHTSRAASYIEGKAAAPAAKRFYTRNSNCRVLPFSKPQAMMRAMSLPPAFAAQPQIRWTDPLMAMAIRKTTKVVALCLGLLVLATGLLLRHTPAGCRILGGRWGGVHSTCVTRLCHYTGSCGIWVHPMVPCSAIPVGTGYAALHFLLGDPAEVEGERYR